VPSLEKKACNKCFKKIIEKRFSKVVNELGINKALIKDERPSDELLKFLFEKKGVEVRFAQKSNVNQSTLDDIAVSVLKSFFSGKDLVIKDRSPLEGISEKELIDYACLVGINFKGNPRSGEDKRAHDFIMKLDERRPGVMYSFRDFIKKLFKQSK